MTMIGIGLGLLDILLGASLAGALAIACGYLALPVQFWLQRRHPAPSAPLCPPDALLPAVLVQLAVFNEPHVVTGLLDCVTALDWPRDRLHIQLLDDSFDDTPQIAAPLVAELMGQGFRIDHLRRADRAGYKAGALAAGLAASDAPFVAILDADFRPPQDWLRAAMPLLLAAPRGGFVQSRCEFANWNANALTRAQGLLLDAHFVIEQNMRARAGLLFQFNGTAGIWRRAAITAAGGWSDDSLSEDLDLTVRAEIAGWHGVFAFAPAVPGRVPERMGDWRVQQRRWSSGFAQTARKLLIAIARAPWGFRKKIGAAFLILYQAAFPLVSIALGCFLSVWAVAGHAPRFAIVPGAAFLVMLPLILIGMTLPPFLVLRRGGLLRYAVTVISLPPLLLYLSLANSLPMIAAALGRRESFKRTPKPGAGTPDPV